MSKPLWRPSFQSIADSNFSKYFKFLKDNLNLDFSDYNSLYQWSVTEPALFWKSMADFSQLKLSKTADSILSGENMFETRWFGGAKLNFAENLLRFQDSHFAIIHKKENSPSQTITYQELFQLTAQAASGFKKLNLSVNDRVAAFIPNIPEAVIGMLATTSIGALWSSCSPDFGIQGVCDRFSQIEPKLLLTVESYFYNGKKIDLRDKIKEIVSRIASIEKVIVISDQDSIDNDDKYISWDSFLDKDSTQLSFEQLPFDHPVYIMYSSGTTGKPKCIVHGAGGTLLQHFKEHSLHTNLSRDDILFYFTTTGWMMWNWLVSGLQIGCTIYLYDGSPLFPKADMLWETAETDKITVFGTSPKYLSVSQERNLIPKKRFDLSDLRTILTTGSPLSEENFDYVYESIKEDLQLASISGGTDIISCFMLGNPILPVYRGEIQCRGLGMKVETFDDSGRPVSNQVGELVCTAPFPSMPIKFWNDDDNRKYYSAYFEHFPGIWRHGDYIKITENDGVIVYGRSDATLNPGGVRIGTAEIYAPLEAMNEIADSIVIGYQVGSDIEIILFLRLQEGLTLTEQLKDKVQKRIREKTSPRHVPAKIFQVKDIPVTINGKKVELTVAKVVSGKEIQNKEALANPDSLKEYENILKRGDA